VTHVDENTSVLDHQLLFLFNFLTTNFQSSIFDCTVNYCWEAKNTITTPTAANGQAIAVMSIFMLVILWPRPPPPTNRPVRPTEEIVPKDAFSPARTDRHPLMIRFIRSTQCVYVFFSYLFSEKAILFSTREVVTVVMFRHHKNKVENGTTGNFIEFPTSPSLSDNRCNRFKTKNFYYVLTQYKKRDEIINQPCALYMYCTRITFLCI